MAGEKFDSKTFNPQAFGRYMETVPKTKLNALIKANIFRGNAEIRNAFANQTGTGYAVLPMYGRLSGKPANYDGKTKYGDAKSLNTYERGVVVFGRKDKFTEQDFSYDITSGVDFMSQIGAQLGEYWDDANEATLVSIIKGIFSMTGEGNDDFVKAHTFEITSETEEPKVTTTDLNNAIQKASGDKKAKYAMAIMHSYIATQLENQKLLTYLTYNDANGLERQLNLAQWNGKLVLVDDAYTIDGEGNYITYVLGNGVFDYEDLGAKVPYEMKRDADDDRDYLYSRERLCIAPYGISYTKKSQATLSPTDEELAKGENWELVNDGDAEKKTYFNHKEIAIAQIISKVTPSPATKQVTVAMPEGEVLGIDVSLLQEVKLNNTKVTGTSKYVESFPQFDKDAKGNFLALKCEEATKGDNIEWELSEAQTKGKGTLDSDGILVVQLHSNTQTITLKNGETSKKLDLTGITLAQKSMAVRTVTEIKEQLDKLGIEYDKKATKADLLTLLPQKG